MTSEPLPIDGPDVDVSNPRVLLHEHLNWYRDALMRKVAGLSEAQACTPVEPMGWEPIAVVKHLALVERRWIRWGFAAENVEPCLPEGHAAEWRLGADESVNAVLALWRHEVELSTALTDGSPVEQRAGVGGRFGTLDEAPDARQNPVSCTTGVRAACRPARHHP